MNGWLSSAVALVLCAAVASCGGDGGDRTQTAPVSQLGAARFTGAGAPGTIYVAVETKDVAGADLYRIRGAASSARRLSRGANISVISARKDAVVVSFAQGTGGDHVAALDLSGGPILPGRLIDASGQAPELSGDGRVAYSRPIYSDDGDVIGARAYVAGVDGRHRHLAFSARYQFTIGWSADNQLAFVRSAGDRIVVDPARPRQRTIDPQIKKVSNFQSNAQGDIWATNPTQIAVVTRGGASRAFTTSWAPASWSPDGRSILVVTEHRLGLMSPVDGTVREIGRVPEGTIAYATYAR
jgi:hypothetical protein